MFTRASGRRNQVVPRKGKSTKVTVGKIAVWSTRSDGFARRKILVAVALQRFELHYAARAKLAQPSGPRVRLGKLRARPVRRSPKPMIGDDPIAHVTPLARPLRASHD